MALVDTIADVWRAFETGNVPSSGLHDPVKSEIIGVLTEMAGVLQILQDGGIIGSAVVKETKSALDADLAHGAGTLGLVWGDSTDANNGLYSKTGGSGSGSWSFEQVYVLPATVLDDLAALSSELDDTQAEVLDLRENRGIWRTTQGGGTSTLISADMPADAPTLQNGLQILFSPQTDIGDDAQLSINSGGVYKYIYRADQDTKIKANDIHADELTHLAYKTGYSGFPFERWVVVGMNAGMRESPAFTGNPTAPTQSAGDDSTRIATTAFVTDAVDVEHDRAIAAEALKAPLNDPVLTGDPRAPTKPTVDNDTSIATTAFVHDVVDIEETRALAAEALLAPKDSPTFTGNPIAPTRTPGSNTTFIATTAFVTAAVDVEETRALAAEALLAPKDSPTFTGSPIAPTRTPGSNTTFIATTAFVTAAVEVESDRAEAAEALLAPKDSPTFTGSPIAPTRTPGSNTTFIATTAFVTDAVGTEEDRATTAEALLAPKLSPALTGNPTAPTQSAGNDSTRIATTAFVTAAVEVESDRAVSAESTISAAVAAEQTRAQAAEALLAPKESPVLTGDPQTPTRAYTNDSTSIASTAFVQNVVGVKEDRALAAEADLATTIDAEVSRAQVAEAALQTAIGTKASTSDLAIERTARVAGDEVTASLMAQNPGRPGDAPSLWTNTLQGGDGFVYTIAVVVPEPEPGEESDSVTAMQFQQGLWAQTPPAWSTVHDNLPDVGQPARIQWDTGQDVAPGDILAVTTQSILGYSDEQMALLFAAARSF